MLDTEQKPDAYLPGLTNFTYGPVDNFGTLDTSSITSSADTVGTPALSQEEVWAFDTFDADTPRANAKKSWERFYDKDFQEPRTLLVSERGPRIFDFALDAQSKIISDGRPNYCPGQVFQSEQLLKGLWLLALGRESIFYRFSRQSQSFYTIAEDCRTSGISIEAFESVSSTFISHGNNTRRMWDFVHKIQSSTSASATLVALARCVSEELAGLQSLLGDSLKSVRSLLQLLSRLERPSMVLSSLMEIVIGVHDQEEDYEILSTLYEVIRHTEDKASWLRPTMTRIFAAASEPWLESVSGWLGLHSNKGMKHRFYLQPPGFVKVIPESCQSEIKGGAKENAFGFEPSSIPSFINEDTAKAIFEIGKSLRLLEAHQPSHPLLQPLIENNGNAPRLEWGFSWGEIERIQKEANWYGSSLQSIINKFNFQDTKRMPRKSNQSSRKLHDLQATQNLSEEAARAYIDTSIATFEKPLSELSMIVKDTLLDAKSLEVVDGPEETFAPPMSLVPLFSIDPINSAQGYLINRACLHLLFSQYDLRSQLMLLHRYSLFGDGVFASRLSHALFDPELHTAERRKGHMRAGISGLRLGSRESWPPASSELRLALTGILAESYHQSVSGSSMFGNELPGGLSFSIREMSEEELQRCMNPDSIEALDFLKLEYKPPSPLDAVITSVSLLKYDAIFKLLLRAVRMLFVVNQFFRDTKAKFMAHQRGFNSLHQLFKMESHHFVSAICSYFFDGVQANWAHILERLEYAESNLDRDIADSLCNLRDFHDSVLDQMMFALMLRKRQAQVMNLVEGIFSLVLQFARHIRLEDLAQQDGQGAINNAELSGIYRRFKKKVGVFISVCRGLSERRGQGGIAAQQSHLESSRMETGELEGNTISRLVLKLEMSGYFLR